MLAHVNRHQTTLTLESSSGEASGSPPPLRNPDLCRDILRIADYLLDSRGKGIRTKDVRDALRKEGKNTRVETVYDAMIVLSKRGYLRRIIGPDGIQSPGSKSRNTFRRTSYTTLWRDESEWR